MLGEPDLSSAAWSVRHVAAKLVVLAGPLLSRLGLAGVSDADVAALGYISRHQDVAFEEALEV